MMNDTYEQKRIKSLEAMLDTEREAARAEHQSGLNLVKYCGDESAWSLPMRGNDIVVRDYIQSLRQRLAEAKPEHVCGLCGFGHIDDVCPACRAEAAARQKEGEGR